MANEKSEKSEKKKTTAVTDPLEAAKIASKPPPPPPPPPAPEPELFGPSGEVEPKAPPPKRYMVVKTTTISLEGNMHRLHAGVTVSEQDYGPRGMKAIRDANVPLRELSDAE